MSRGQIVHPALEALLDIIQSDPYPEGYTSSYWKDFGAKNIVCRRNGEVVLESYGIGSMRSRWLASHTLFGLERSSYRHVTAGLAAYRRIWSAAKALARDLGFSFTFDVWKNAVILALLEDHWRTHNLSPATFAIIGDGYGFLGALIRRCRPVRRMYCVDLPKTLAFQIRTHELSDAQARMHVLGRDNSDSTADISFVLPQDVDRVEDTLDFAANIASMEEMNEFTIKHYFSFLRRRSGKNSRFYCVNRVHKQLPGGEISRFMDYPWSREDEIFLDGPCPFYTHFLARYTLPNGPRVLGVRVPCINYFDGQHLQRLVRLAPET